jgi:type-F conjugative transfer system mating-pair stabilization protein TraN
VIEIEIIPEKRAPGRCGGHPGNVKKGKTKYDNLSWCSPGRGCNAEKITQHRQIKIIKDEWIDDCAVLEDKADQGLCRYVEAQMGGAETRTLVGKVINPEAGKPETEAQPITRDSWVENYTYACMHKSKNGCEALRSKGCIQTKSVCIEEVGGVCVVWRQNYACVTGKKGTKRYKSADGKTLFCLTGDCTDSDYEVNGELAEALAQMAVLKEAQDDIRANVGIFKGQSRACRKNCAGFRDCCKNGNGWGVDMHLSECNGEEKELANWRSKKRCTYIGTYCAEKLAGKCIRKKSTFCCFGSKLAKLINEQGRRQLGIGFGDVKSPDCRGLTPEELSRIDMSAMDLSELYEDVMEKFKVPSGEHMATGIELERIRENMQHLTKGKAHTTNQKTKTL